MYVSYLKWGVYQSKGKQTDNQTKYAHVYRSTLRVAIQNAEEEEGRDAGYNG